MITPADKDLRFGFGKNWRAFLELVDEERVESAERSLIAMLGRSTLDKSSFVDVGCGSGLLSLAAVRLGASVHSFDYDEESVECAREMRRRFSREAQGSWVVEQGSVLDRDYLGSLGSFDFVYSWGVLHHTGDLWKALDNVLLLLKPGGTLFVSIYNDQGRVSRIWTRIKRAYNQAPDEPPFFQRRVILLSVAAFFELRSGLSDLIVGRNPLSPKAFAKRRATRKNTRGMSWWHDMVDWVGGYPFEVAKPEEVFVRLRSRGLTLTGLKTCGGGLGCNEFVFRLDESG